MSGWPVTLALGAGGVTSLLLAGLGSLGGAAPPAALSLARTLVPIRGSGYAGRDFPPLSVDADDVFGIDLGPALDQGDALEPSGVQLIFYPVEGGAANYAAAIDGAAGLIGTVAVQAIGRPPAGRYLLGFTCATAAGRTIEIHSFFNAASLPDAAV
jgi:hypothetical protein